MNFFYNLQDALGLGDRDPSLYYRNEESTYPDAAGLPHQLFASSDSTDPDPSNHLDSASSSNVIGVPGWLSPAATMTILELRSFDDATQAILALREQQSVILNLQLMDADQAQRTVDYVAGGTFALDGQQHQLGEHIFLFTPSPVQVHIDSSLSPATEQATASSPIQTDSAHQATPSRLETPQGYPDDRSSQAGPFQGETDATSCEIP